MNFLGLNQQLATKRVAVGQKASVLDFNSWNISICKVQKIFFHLLNRHLPVLMIRGKGLQSICGKLQLVFQKLDEFFINQSLGFLNPRNFFGYYQLSYLFQFDRFYGSGGFIFSNLFWASDFQISLKYLVSKSHLPCYVNGKVLKVQL